MIRPLEALLVSVPPAVAIVRGGFEFHPQPRLDIPEHIRRPHRDHRRSLSGMRLNAD